MDTDRVYHKVRLITILLWHMPFVFWRTDCEKERYRYTENRIYTLS